MAAKPRLSCWSQFCPYCCGLLTSPTRLEPKTAAATTAATAIAVLASALRTGTAVRPCPGSNAIRVPTPPVTVPVRVSAPASQDGRADRGAGQAAGDPAAPVELRA